MHLERKLFGEVLPFRMNYHRGYIPLRGGLTWHDDYFEADRTILFPVEDGLLKVRVGYDNIPPELHDPDSGSAVWFHDVDGLRLRVALPEGFHYDFNVRVLSAPDFFLNEGSRPEPYPPAEDDEIRPFDYTLEITDNRWWSSDEHSDGREWHFSVNDLPSLPSIRDSELCQLNTAPGTYPGAYFTCALEDHHYPGKFVEYWFNYELESPIDRAHYLGTDRPAGSRHQYRFCFGRTDKQELDTNEAHRILDLWEYLLGFCSGSLRGVDFAIGYGAHGGWTYAELPRRLTRQLPCRNSWFPQKWPFDFPAFARQFLTYFQKEYDLRSKMDGVPAHFFDPNLRVRHGFGAAIPILEGYLRAASLEIPHDALNAAFSTLESEAKQHLNLPDQSRVPPGGAAQFLRDYCVPPGQRNRGLGSRGNAAWQPLRAITGLKEPPQGATSWVLEPDYKPDRDANQDDEEYGVNAIKSWRDKRASHFDAHAGGGTFHDVQNYAQLTLEYLELLVLNKIGYGGLYRSRTGIFHQAVKLVPWAGDSVAEQQ